MGGGGDASLCLFSNLLSHQYKYIINPLYLLFTHKPHDIPQTPTPHTKPTPPNSDEDALTAYEPFFLPRALDEFLGVVEGGKQRLEGPALRFVERFLEFLVDLLGQLPTRRFLKVYV